MDWIELIIGIIGSSTISGLILYYLNRPVTNVSIDKSKFEIKKIEQDLESQYIKQLEQWLADLRQIKDKHEGELKTKDSDIIILHRQYLAALSELADSRFQFDRLNHAIRTVLIGLDIAFWETDSEGKIVYCNGAWLNLFGLTKEQSSGDGWTIAVPESERKDLLLKWSSAVLDQREKEIDFNIQHAVTNEIYPVRAIYSMVYDKTGNLLKIIGVTFKV